MSNARRVRIDDDEPTGFVQEDGPSYVATAHDTAEDQWAADIQAERDALDASEFEAWQASEDAEERHERRTHDLAPVPLREASRRTGLGRRTGRKDRASSVLRLDGHELSDRPAYEDLSTHAHATSPDIALLDIPGDRALAHLPAGERDELRRLRQFPPAARASKYLGAHDPWLTVAGVTAKLEARAPRFGLTLAEMRSVFGGGRPSKDRAALRVRVRDCIAGPWDKGRSRVLLAQALGCSDTALRGLMADRPGA